MHSDWVKHFTWFAKSFNNGSVFLSRLFSLLEENYEIASLTNISLALLYSRNRKETRGKTCNCIKFSRLSLKIPAPYLPSIAMQIFSNEKAEIGIGRRAGGVSPVRRQQHEVDRGPDKHPITFRDPCFCWQMFSHRSWEGASWLQCDQMAIFLFNLWPFKTMTICPVA